MLKGYFFSGEIFSNLAMIKKKKKKTLEGKEERQKEKQNKEMRKEKGS